MAAAASAANKSAPRKLTINLSKKKSNNSAADSEENFESTWLVLADFVRAVHELHITRHSLQELYAAVEALVMAKRGGDLYTRVVDMCRQNIQRLVSASQHTSADVRTFLARVQEAWSTHTSQMLMIRNVFIYLDRTYVRDTQGVKSLWDVGLHLFREALMATGDVLPKIIAGIVSQCCTERAGEPVDRPMLSTLSRMLMALRLYATHLEPALITSTAEFYESEGLAKVSALDVPQYLIDTEERLRQEKDRVLSYLDSNSLRPTIAAVEAKLITMHKMTLLEKGFASLVENHRKDDLRRMYELLLRVDALESIRKVFADYTKRKAQSLVAEESEEKDKQIISELLGFKAVMDGIISDSFARNEAFSSALKAALEFAVNARENKPAELLAKHVDALMRGGTKAAGVTTDDEFDAVLDKSLSLFRCIHGKDVFEAFYKKDLAKRLLLDKSASADLEKSMVAKLKAECGAAFTSKLEGMFKDTGLSDELMAQFQASKFSKGTTSDIFVRVLTSSYWPPYTSSLTVIPLDIRPSLDAFEAFYNDKYSSGRKLQWNHQLGHCHLKAAFPLGKKELEVSFHQAVVLLMFNDSDELSFKELKDRTNIEDAELRRTLQSLALGKVRALRKEPKGKEVEDADLFTYNAEFKDPLFRLKINTIQVKETKQEVDATHAKVEEDRQYQMDAALVRIMKARKVLGHQQLLAESFAQLRFPAKAQDLKKRIESLIDRDYLERDPKEPSTYHYIA